MLARPCLVKGLASKTTTALALEVVYHGKGGWSAVLYDYMKMATAWEYHKPNSRLLQIVPATPALMVLGRNSYCYTGSPTPTPAFSSPTPTPTPAFSNLLLTTSQRSC